MSRITIDDIYTLGVTEKWISTDWIISKTKEFKNEDILFESLNDTVNKRSIIAVLRNKNGTLYYPENGSYAKVRINYETFSTPYFIIDPICNKKGTVEKIERV